MAFEEIERVKADWTDKYVVVDATQPELARFAGGVGIVKTVNMSGRALVQFDLCNNIGWYDIDPAFLKQVPKPEPKPQEEARKKAAPAAGAGAVEEKKAAARKSSTAEILAAARGKATGEAGPATAAGQSKMSTADVLAAARGAAQAVPSAPGKEGAGQPKLSTADILAAARGKSAGAAAAKPAAAKAAQPKAAAPPEAAPRPAPAKDVKKMSTAEILAAARAGKSDGSAGAPPQAAEPVPAAPVAEASAEVAREPAPQEQKAVAPPAAGVLPQSVPEILAWCRKHDARK